MQFQLGGGQMIKILHVINNLGSGGAEKLLEELLPLINENESIDADVLILTDKNNVFYDSLISKEVNVKILKYRNIYDLRNIFEIKKSIIDGYYDIVHSHTFPTQYWVALSKLFIYNEKIKFITTEHSTHNRRRDKFYFRPIDRFIYFQYDSIISITEKTRDNLIDWIDPKRKKIDKHIIIENGVNIQKIKEALPYKKSELIEGISEDIKLVCMVGRFSEAKDQPTLIRAISKLPEEIHLALVGEGPLMLNNEKLADELGIANRVHFLGFRKDIPKILKTVDVVVLSSHWEGLSLASIEGLASEKPFIASKVPGLEEIVEGYGILFEEGNDDKLYEIIRLLMNDKNTYDQIIKRCIERSQKYEIRNTVNNLLELYKKIID